MRVFISIVLGIVLLGTGMAKVMSGFDDGYAINSRVSYYAIAGMEILVGLATLLGRRMTGAVFAVLLGVGGISVALLHPDKPCGCLGSLVALQGAHQIMAAGTLGGLGSLVILFASVSEAPE